MDDDPFGFCYRLEKDLAKVLDKAGLAALTDQVPGRFDAAAQMARVPDERPGADQGYLRGAGRVLRTLYLAQKHIDAYLGLAEETGLTADDCHAVARMLVARRRPEEALPRPSCSGGASCPVRRFGQTAWERQPPGRCIGCGPPQGG